MKKYLSTVMASLMLLSLASVPFTAVRAAGVTAVPVFRLYQPTSGDHFYTTSTTERDFAKSISNPYGLETNDFYAFPTTDTGLTPVYRLYQPTSGDHFYTTSTTDRDFAKSISHPYTDEGTAFYESSVAATGMVPVYRLYQPMSGDHFYTATVAQRDFAKSISHPYTDEGIAFYAPAGAVTTQVTGNLIGNPSVETNTVAGTPDSFTYGTFGTGLAATSSYNATGHTGSHSLGINVTTAPTGTGAEWAHAPVTVTPKQLYQFSDWYQSNVDTEVDVAITHTDGTAEEFDYVGKVLASPGAWKQFIGQFVMPANAATATFYQVINSKGTLTTDDYALVSGANVPGFTSAMVSVDFDDGWTSQYTNALPILTADKIPATMFIISSEPTNAGDAPDYMNWDQIKAFQSQGSEIGSHTVTHPVGGLPALPVGNNTTPNTMDYELFQSKVTLQGQLGNTAAIDFASPEGAYNATVLAEIKKYYSSHRSVDSGFNDKDNFDVYNIHVQSVTSATPASQIEAWIDQAIQTKTWLVLVYHEVVTDGSAGLGGDVNHTNKSDLQAEMDYINAHRSQITPMTTRAAIQAIQAQL